MRVRGFHEHVFFKPNQIMIHFSISTERLLLLLIFALVLCNLFLKQCNTNSKTNSPTSTITRDTIWKVKTDTFTIQTVKYKTVYVAKKNVADIIEDTLSITDQTKYTKAKVYRDTLQNDELDLYSYSLIDGKLLDSKLSYTLKVPKEIKVTETITYPKTYRSGIYVFSEIGGNKNQFDNLSLGLQYNRKGSWFASYRVNLNTTERPTHNVGIGVRLFK